MTKYFLSDRFQKIFPYLIINAATFVLMVIWFWNRQILASSESALPFANLTRYVELTANSWSNYALGNYPGFISASWLTYVGLFWLSSMGLPGYLVEATFFYLIFVLSGVAIYQLTSELFPETKRSFLLLAVVYYWFNSFALVNIWNRFLYNYMVFSALLPLSVWLFIRGLRLKKYYYCYLIGVLSLVFSYASTSPPFDFLLWFVLGLISLLNILWSRRKEERIFVVKFFVCCLSIYVLVNVWWISQMFSYSEAAKFSPATNLFFNSIDNLNTIEDLSYRLGNVTDVFRLMHSDFFQNKEVAWIAFFNRSVAIVFEYTVILVVLLVMAVKFKKRSILLCGLFVFMGFFLMLGSAPPFGEMKLWLFAHFSILQLFRNPFEKFGFLVPVFLSPVLGFSFYWVFGKINFLKYSGLVLLMLFVYFYGKPFITKDLFSYHDQAGNWKSYSVSVPDDYRQANEWIKSQGNNFRVIAFPLGGEGITYNWEYPFSGVESTNTLLNIPAISYNTTIPYYADISSKIEEDFLFDPNFLTKAKLLNVRYILLRSDVNFQDRLMTNPQIIDDRIDYYQTKGDLHLAGKFGQLSFWEVTGWHDTSITGLSFEDTSAPVQSFKLINSDSTQSAMVDRETTQLSHPKLNRELFLPNDSIFIESVTNNGYERDQQVFPFVSHLPTDLIYPMVRLKEILQILFIFNPKKQMEAKIFFLGKRISEIETALNQHKKTDFEKALFNYQSEFYSLNLQLERYSKNPDSQYQIWKSAYLNKIFTRHQNYFQQLSINTKLTQPEKQTVNNLKQLFQQQLQERSIVPVKTRLLPSDDHFDRWEVYKFSNLQKGQYRLVSANKINALVNQQFEYDFFINGVKIRQKVLVNSDRRIDFGLIDLENGDNEIAFKPLDKHQDFNAATLPVDGQESLLNLGEYDPSSFFKFSFKYVLPEGGELNFNQYSDNGILKKDRKIPLHSAVISNPMVKASDNSETLLFFPPEHTHETQIGIFLKNPICQELYFGDNNCLKTNLEDVQIKQYFKIEPVLELSKSAVPSGNQVEVSYSKINDSRYRVNIKGLNAPVILILNQLYHSGWQLKINTVSAEHVLVNSYANGWIVNAKGDLEGDIYFNPDYYYRLYLVVSGVSFVFLSLGFNYYYFRNKLPFHFFVKNRHMQIKKKYGKN